MLVNISRQPVPRNFYHRSELVTPCVRAGTRTIQPANSLVQLLPPQVILQVLQHVSQYDLVSMALVCTQVCPLALDRLYRRVTVALDPQVPRRYRQDVRRFVRDNAIKYMDLALIVSPRAFARFYTVTMKNPALIGRIKFFVFDKCSPELRAALAASHPKLQKAAMSPLYIPMLNGRIMARFAHMGTRLNFIHLAFEDFASGISQLTRYLSNPASRSHMFKLVITSLRHLHTPMVPPCITNLFVLLDELELVQNGPIDLQSPDFRCISSLNTLTVRTKHHLGLQVVRALQLPNNNDPRMKLQLKGLSVYHCHNKCVDVQLAVPPCHTALAHRLIQSIDKRLQFLVLDAKIHLTRLSHLFFKVDCVEHRNRNCLCFVSYFNEWTAFLNRHDGLPNLTSLEVELYPNYEWLRPQQLLDGIIRPVGQFARSLKRLHRFSLDLASPGFKIFDPAVDLSSSTLNKMNEQLIETFVLSIYTGHDSLLRVLQLPDFVTSFLYYMPQFHESLLHTCRCWGCNKVLERLRDLFFPLPNHDDVSAYYVILGYAISNLQTDREVYIPIKQSPYNYDKYPMHRGHAHALHYRYHANSDCECNVENDPAALDPTSVDNLVVVYIIHQLWPIVGFLARVFRNIDKLVIHGIHYQRDCCRFVPIFDNDHYPVEWMRQAAEGNTGEPDLAFGTFRQG